VTVHRARHPIRPPVRPLVSLLVLPLVLACGGGRRSPAASSTRIPGPTSAAPSITPLPDANTAAILVASHDADLAAARIAVNRGQHRDVKLLARSILTDHTSMYATLGSVLETSNVHARDDDVSRLLREQGVARRDTLRNLSGRRFDSTYVEHEVRFHQDLLVAIDEVFLPSVRSAGLREHVGDIRARIASHLALARQVRLTLAARR
jgi:putative membrane protein